MEERFNEHLKEPFPIYDHSINTVTLPPNITSKIIRREDHGIARTIEESIYISVNTPTLNRNIGKYNLHHIWDRFLLNTHGPKIKRHVQAIGHAQNTQPISPAPLNQPNTPIQLSQPTHPHAIFHRFYEACPENTLV